MTRSLLATVLLLGASAAHADFADDFKACAAIAGDSARLACYDALAKHSSAAPAAILPAAPVAAAAPQPANLTPAMTPEQRFGLESVEKSAEQKAQETDVIASRLSGPFKGWDPKTKFVLKNGQVWKNIGGDTVFLPDGGEDKIVTIEKGAFGAYYLGVEGLNRKAKVKRIK